MDRIGDMVIDSPIAQLVTGQQGKFIIVRLIVVIHQGGGVGLTLMALTG